MSAGVRISDPTIREWVRIAQREGWKVAKSGGHVVIVSPVGQRMALPCSPRRNGHGLLNVRARLRRAGLPV